MSLSHSASIVRNGLVFYYDMGNTQKSWKGKPTTNYATPTLSSWSVDGSGQGNIGARTIISSYYARIDDNASNCRQSTYVEGLSASTVYTFSIKYRRLSGTPTLRFQLQAYNGGTYLSTMAFPTTAQLGITDIDGWQTAYYTVTTPASTTRAMWFVQDGDDYTTYTHSFEVKEPQCETGTFPTLFVSGSRSTTQALLDLTNSNTLTTTSLSYSTDNTFSFDGSSSIITSPNNTALDTQTPTVEVWVKTNATTQNGFWFEKGSVNTQYALFQEGANIQWRLGPLGDLSTTTATYMNTTNWYQVVGTYTSGDKRLYINGVQVNSNTATGSLSTNSSGVSVGAYGGATGAHAYYYNGSIGIVRIYNRVLSASEVLQNFNAQRDRYGI